MGLKIIEIGKANPDTESFIVNKICVYADGQSWLKYGRFFEKRCKPETGTDGYPPILRVVVNYRQNRLAMGLVLGQAVINP
jgi:hypothetical protein